MHIKNSKTPPPPMLHLHPLRSKAVFKKIREAVLSPVPGGNGAGDKTVSCSGARC